MTPELGSPNHPASAAPIADAFPRIETLLIELGCESSTPAAREAVRSEQSRRFLEAAALARLGVYDVPAGLRLSVVVPVYNELATLDELLRRVEAVPIDKEIILVDDGSDDGTRELIAARDGRPGHVVHCHDRNRGKGAAIRAGFERATGDVVLVQDADLEYDPQDYFRLIQPIVEDRADVVFGSRYLPGGARRAQRYWHTQGNRWLTRVSNMLTNLCLTDMETCYKVFRREALLPILPTLKQNGFGIEAELTAKVARRKLRVYEVPISYAGRDYTDGKKIGWRDAVAAAYCLARYSRWD